MQLLHNIKVVDMTQYLSASYCSEILGDLGADVIKVEAPGKGEVYRTYGPKFIGGESTSYLALNRNKRSIAINIKSDEGKEALKAIIKTADVLVENFRVGTLDRYGLGYEDMKAINPGLVYCSVSGFGLTGPYATKGGFDLIAQAMSGIMAVTGEKGGAPVKVGYPVTDIGGGMYGAIGVLAALMNRETTGKGCHVDTSLFETGAAWGMQAAMSYLADGGLAGRMGSASPLNAPYEGFDVSDGSFVMGSGNQMLWEKFCHIFDMDELLENDDYSENYKRVQHQQQLHEEIQAHIKDRKVADCIALMDEAGIPCGTINNMANLFEDPQIEARGMLLDVEHMNGKDHMKAMALPLHFDGEICQARLHPPKLGEHSVEILKEVGYTDEQIKGLVDGGFVAVSK